MHRIFVVGFPRSGTTIVQSWLARHLAVFTLPETSFFEHACGNLRLRWGDPGAEDENRPWHRFGSIHGAARRTYAEVVRSLGEARPRRLPTGLVPASRVFVDVLDRAAARRGAAGWIEKTPNHVYYVDEIERLVPGATFIHVVRRGEDALASIVDAQIRFGSFDGGIADWARRWNVAMHVHARYANRPNHTIVSYESFVSSARERFRVSRFLGIPPQTDAPGDPARVADLEREPWKAAATSGLIAPSERKREAIFGPRVAAWLAENLTTYAPPYGTTRLGNGEVFPPAGAAFQPAASRAASTGS